MAAFQNIFNEKMIKSPTTPTRGVGRLSDGQEGGYLLHEKQKKMSLPIFIAAIAKTIIT